MGEYTKSQHQARIKEVRYSHDAMIDHIIADPRISQNELAQIFGYSVGWVSRILGSDAFQAALAKRRAEVLNPALVVSIEERVRGLEIQSAEILAKKLEATQDAGMALKVLEMGAKSRGYGARPHNLAIQQNFVVAMPGRVADAQEWAQEYAPGGQAVVREELEHRKPEPVAEVVEVVEEVAAVGTGARYIVPRPAGWEQQP